MKTNQIVSFLAGLVALLLLTTGCVSEKKNVSFRQVTPSGSESESKIPFIMGKTGSTPASAAVASAPVAKAAEVTEESHQARLNVPTPVAPAAQAVLSTDDDEVVHVGEVHSYSNVKTAGTTTYTDNSTYKEFDPLRSLKGILPDINAVVVVGGGGRSYGGGYEEECYDDNRGYQGGGYNRRSGGRGNDREGDFYRRRNGGGDGRYDRRTDGYGREPRPYVQNTQGRRTNPRVEQPQYRRGYRDRDGNVHPEGYYYANGSFYPTHR